MGGTEQKQDTQQQTGLKLTKGMRRRRKRTTTEMHREKSQQSMIIQPKTMTAKMVMRERHYSLSSLRPI
jgi:hypothetical protein